MKDTGTDLMAQANDEARPSAWVRVSRDRVEAFVALAAFAVLCIVVLSPASRLVEPDDYAYRASIVAITQGHFLTLSTAQVDRLAAQLPGPVAGAPGVLQWVQLPGGRWISEKDPGYPFLAAPFQAAGIIRLAEPRPWRTPGSRSSSCGCLFARPRRMK